MEKTKICGKCERELPIGRFDQHTQKGRKTWIRNVCKDCNNKRARELRALRKKPRKPHEKRYYEVLEGGGYFRGLLPLCGFVETVKAGYFPDGMKVRRTTDKRVFVISGSKMKRVAD